jgi:hypothetical protein
MGDCIDGMEEILRSGEAEDWVPRADLARIAVAALHERGRGALAASLARRAGRAYPDDGLLLFLEFRARSDLEEQDAVARELLARARTSQDLSVKLTLAAVFRREEDAASMAEVLGDTPPSGAEPAQREQWLLARLSAAGMAQDGRALRAARDLWIGGGGDARTAAAAYALTLSLARMEDPERPRLELLLESAALAEGALSRELAERVLGRAIAELVVGGRSDLAVQLYERGIERGYVLPMYTRQDLERAELSQGLLAVADGAEQVDYRFVVPEGAAEGQLLVSHDPDKSSDFDELRVVPRPPRGDWNVRVPASIAPLRWVFRDDSGAVLASGNAWAAPGRAARVEVRPGPAQAPMPPFSWSPHKADGRRRVVGVVWDCADWRLVQYLRARGELPVTEALMRRGRSGTLLSRPPYTAAAMTALVEPAGRTPDSVLQVLYELGAEARERSAQPRNPMAFLSALLPHAEDLFRTIGAGEHVATNLLFSHGVMDGARQGETVGPHGAIRPPVRVAAWRPLAAEERSSVRGLEQAFSGADVETNFTEAAALLDASAGLLREGRSDLLLLRVATMDILTHRSYAGLSAGGQDDGQNPLLTLYRYADRRLGDLLAALDSDDFLVLLSDHGIQTAMQHDDRCVFVAVGPGVEPGRIEGTPSIRGLPRLLADLLGVPTRWPDTGLRLGATPARPPSGPAPQ